MSIRTPNKKLVTATATLCVILCCTLVCAAVTYQPGTVPTCTLTHKTVETLPSDQSRTTIGICEQVDLWITGWTDTDIEVDGEISTSVSDAMGDVDWSCDGSGSVFPAIGAGTTYTAQNSYTNSTETVTAVTHDSGTEAVETVTQSVTFSILVPNGATALVKKDATAGPAGTNFVGALTNYGVQILPATVNFSRVQVRENIPSQTANWPDGVSVSTFGGVKPSVTPSDSDPMYNMVVDQVSTGVWPIACLDNGTGYQDFSYTFNCPLEFYSVMACPNWWPFTTDTLDYVYRGATTQQARVGWNNAVSMPGGWQGPYDSISSPF